MSFTQLFAFVILCCSHWLAIDAAPNRPLLRGVTIRNWPYADRLNDRYEGFVVDLMNLISEHAGFSYQLYFSPDGKYGSEFNGHINGMIGEVYRNRADFAIADLTVTDARKRFVDFTEPFLENQLSAIVRRDDSVGLRTLEDLVTMNEINRASDVAVQNNRGVIAYGTYRTGSTYYHLSKSRDPIAVRMYNWMLRNPAALVTSAKEGFDRVNAGRYAFIVESTFAEYLTGLYCNLTTLYDTRSLYPRQFSIALPKGSPHLATFNQAIRELKANGAIEKLRTLYWTNRCNSQNSNAIPPTAVQSQPSPPAAPPSSSSTSSNSVSNGPVTTRRGSENADDRRSGNSIEPSSSSVPVEWTGHRHVEPVNHQRVSPPASTRKNIEYDNEHNYNSYHSRYHNGNKQHNGNNHNRGQNAAFSSASHGSVSSLLLALSIGITSLLLLAG